jgi:hypothetical protein
MTITAFSGPFVQFGTVSGSTNGTGVLGNDVEHNGQRAPAMFDLDFGMMDPRVAYAYQPGGNPSSLALSFFKGVGAVDYIPATANTSAFQATATGSSGVATFALAAASSANGTFSTTIVAPETGTVTGTLIAIDSTAAYVTFGQTGTLAAWNPGGGTGRNIVIKPSSNLDAGNFTVAGRDMYGYKMTETIAGGSTSLAGKKAFKYVSSITNASAPTSTGVSIGFGDVFGLPLYTPYAGQNLALNLNSTAGISAAVIASTTNLILGTTVTQTSTTPDVRGTFTSTTASNALQRLQMQVTVQASGIAAITSTNVAPLFGVAQFSSV